MVLLSDNGGFEFDCKAAKMSLGSSAWSTRLNQLRKMTGRVSILNADLPAPEYAIGVLSKRLADIHIVAYLNAATAAKKIKQALPDIRIALHPDLGAKAIFVAPKTLWIMSGDFGRGSKLDSRVGFHSPDLYEKTWSQLFARAWREAQEITNV
ncbi:hypothetical protein [Pseudomonas brassicacearum]|uniref:hypothetical protein n=1 Tax=Pseudomonas brassicacearum TaxID=930166 RepID=UPI003D6AA0D5